MAKTPHLDAAYGLQSLDEIRELYSDWAETYDASFAQKMHYRLPIHVAHAFVAEGGVGPVLDVGAGTGLVAEALAPLGEYTIDAMDLSPQMLSVAERKGLYRSCIEADVTQPLTLPARYNGIVSAGTFTHGHVGPEALPNLLDVAAAGALFVLSINAQHFAARGFAEALDALASRLASLRIQTVDVYDNNVDVDPDHGADQGHLLIFRSV